MFKHILIPTDGSRLAAKGIKVGVKLAKSLGARVTGLYVAAPYMPPMYGEAGVAAVPCRLDSVSEVQPWRGILRVARARKCDAIVMASHGRGGLGGLLLGSETARVLAHSQIPVLVTR